MPSPTVNAQRFRILEALDLLDPSPDAPLDRFVRIAARAADAPIALVTFVGPHHQVNKASLGLDDPTTPLADAFCVHALDGPALLEVPDALQDERFAHSALVTGPPGVRSYAGQPIVFEGIVLGTVCVLDRVPRRFTEADREVLADLSGLVSDLLARRHEQRLRRLQEQRAFDCAAAAGEWLWETDPAQRVTWMAGRFDDEVGRSAGDRVGETMVDRDVLDGLGRPVAPPLTLAQLMQRREPFRGIVAMLDGVASPRYIERNASPLFDEADGFQGFRGSCREVTDRVHAEQLALEADAARRANRSRSEFLSRVSHELRTPLNAVLGFTQMMLLDDTPDAAPTPVQRERLDIVLQAGQRLLALIDDVLDIGRIEQGGRALSPAAVDVHAAVQDALALLQPECDARSVTLCNLVEPRACVVRADGRALVQVLLTAMSNGVKYNRAGGRVTVRVQPGDPACIVVEDDGPGLDASQLAQLYEPFNRLGAESGTVPGSGLGLVIGKSLVERMHGTLEVSSVAGAGTSVRIALPRAPASNAGAPPPEQRGRRTVLYVEDNTVNAMLMEQLFEEEPAWRLLVASSGQAAIDVASVTPCDLVLVDMNLGDMTGLEVVRALRERGVQPRMGFIAVSADAFAEQVRAATDFGLAAYWTKPLDLREAMRRLRDLLA